MTDRHRRRPRQSQRSRSPERSAEQIYNIIPIYMYNLRTDHPCLPLPELRATINALIRAVDDLRKPPIPWKTDYDLLDWLGFFFGFQSDNVSNQREHLVLHLANAQMRLQTPPDNINTLQHSVIRDFRRKLLKNYSDWCSFVGRKSNIFISDAEHYRELLYVALYLLIWGESANLRFMPECICYIFHHMAMELNRILENYADENPGSLFMPSTSGENAFLDSVVKPIYDIVKAEVANSENGRAPHSNWRNYDDINEYFWSTRCFDEMKWPIDRNCDFFAIKSDGKRVRKKGFVEHRSFLNLFRSFDKLWVMLFLFLQAAIIVAWNDPEKHPWQVLRDKDVQAMILSVFITWSGLRLLKALLDALMEYKLVFRETLWLGVRMVLKIIVSVVWIIIFATSYARVWKQKNDDLDWSDAANKRVATFRKIALVFIIPEAVAIVLFILPMVGNLVETTNWSVFHLMTWWFQSRSFVGRGLSEGLTDKLKYSLFWMLVLGTKLCFSYFLQIRPMIQPTKDLLDLGDVRYEWHEFYSSSNRFAVGVLWLPVVLIYLMDLQIWYSIYASFVGAFVGLFSHLGEIRNVQQLRLRFQFFAGAMQFNLISEDHVMAASNYIQTIRSRIKDRIDRWRLRYGLRLPFKKLESDQIEARKIALIWNEIILTLREEDLLSDREVELLELPQNTWNVRVVQWPMVLLCNELRLARSQAIDLADKGDRVLWYKISKNEYRRCSVIEAYDSVRQLLLTIVKSNTQEHSILLTMFQLIEESINIETFTTTFHMTHLIYIYMKVRRLFLNLTRTTKNVNEVIKSLQDLYEFLVRDFFKKGLAPNWPPSDARLLFVDAVDLPGTGDVNFYRQAQRLYNIMTLLENSMDNIPVNTEARRRIAFFSNSLFMNIPRAPQVKKMMAFSVLTPYYDEEVTYSSEHLLTDNEDWVKIVDYLQTIYPDEWGNFLERMDRDGMLPSSRGMSSRVVRRWASYRGQTLARTVRGMMYYDRALKMLAYLDSLSETDINIEGARELIPMSSTVGMTPSERQNLLTRHDYVTALMKFTYVVACQEYGTQKKKRDPRATKILHLMKENEALRVAYVDQVPIENPTDYYSVLVKYDQNSGKEVEVYRVKLPGPFKLGEGKPENQNHALIFTRGDALQTIDMNQDNYFEEALKMRNLLEEFNRIRSPNILGVREHIFTASVSSLAWFMSAQETSFVTLGQRVLANPLKIRMHYGHPDVFDRFWFLTRGGISKASRLTNLSEDIFAGFNSTLRVGNVTHHEYIQVGKGRDVGLNQVSTFEAKVASGNGEQVLSRDVYRLGQRLDFFRMLSFFYTSVGFFFNTMMVSFTIYAFLWGRLYLALSGVESSMADNANTNKALSTILYQQFLVQLGLLTVLPMIFENTLEFGFFSAFRDFIVMQLQLSSVFFTFSLGTRAHYFGRTILHGGAKYQSTGRGFVVHHTSFAENYRLYARSHFVKAIELGLILVIYAAYSPVAKGTFAYLALTISSWFLVVSWIMAPFVFNPSGFDWLKIVPDFHDFMRWLKFQGSPLAEPRESWERWWYKEYDHLRTTSLRGKFLEIILDLRFFFFQYGMVYKLGISGSSNSIVVYILSWICMAVALVVYLSIVYAREKYSAKERVKDHIYYIRLVQFLVIVPGILIIIALMIFTQFRLLDLLTSLFAFLPTGWGLLLIAQVFRPFLEKTMIWGTVVSVARMYDMMFGMIVLAPVAALSWFPGPESIQTRILFNEAFSRGLGYAKWLSKRNTKTT